jgi:hypothetical protein
VIGEAVNVRKAIIGIGRLFYVQPVMCRIRVGLIVSAVREPVEVVPVETCNESWQEYSQGVAILMVTWQEYSQYVTFHWSIGRNILSV